MSAELSNMTIRVDDSAVMGWLEKHSKHAPHAIAHALNRTAEEAHAAIWAHVQKSFTIRTLPRQFVAPQKLPAKLRARHDKLFAVLQTEGIGTILDPFETGKPHDGRGRPVAVPSSYALGARPFPRYVIPRALYPQNLGLTPTRDAKGGLYYNRGRGSRKRGVSGPPPMQGKLGTYRVGNYIFQRVHGTASRLLWTLKPSVPRPADLHYYATAMRVVTKRWAINLRGEWEYEMRRAGIV